MTQSEVLIMRPKSLNKVENIEGKHRKCLSQAFSLLPCNVFRSLLSQGCENLSSFGKGLAPFPYNPEVSLSNENAGFQHFLLFPQCFQKASFSGSLTAGIVWYRVKS